MADKKAQLIIEGAAPVELPILTGTVGPDVIGHGPVHIRPRLHVDRILRVENHLYRR